MKKKKRDVDRITWDEVVHYYKSSTTAGTQGKIKGSLSNYFKTYNPSLSNKFTKDQFRSLKVNHSDNLTKEIITL